MKKRLCAFFLFCSVVVVATMGIFIGVSVQNKMDTNTIFHCLFHMFGGVRGMILNEHVNNWRNSINGLISLAVLVGVVLFFVVLNLFSLSSLSNKSVFVGRTQKEKRDPPILFIFLNMLFARGIIHPKLFFV